MEEEGRRGVVSCIASGMEVDQVLLRHMQMLAQPRGVELATSGSPLHILGRRRANSAPAKTSFPSAMSNLVHGTVVETQQRVERCAVCTPSRQETRCGVQGEWMVLPGAQRARPRRQTYDHRVPEAPKPVVGEESAAIGRGRRPGPWMHWANGSR